MQKVEGDVSFHTGMLHGISAARARIGNSAGPMTVQAGKLESVLGVTDVKVVRGHNHLAVVDSSLAEAV